MFRIWHTGERIVFVTYGSCLTSTGSMNSTPPQIERAIAFSSSSLDEKEGGTKQLEPSIYCFHLSCLVTYGLFLDIWRVSLLSSWSQISHFVYEPTVELLLLVKWVCITQRRPNPDPWHFGPVTRVAYLCLKWSEYPHGSFMSVGPGVPWHRPRDTLSSPA